MSRITRDPSLLRQAQDGLSLDAKLAQVVHMGRDERCEKEAVSLIDEGASANAYLAHPGNRVRASVLLLAILRGFSLNFIDRLLQEGANPNGLGLRDMRLPVVSAVQKGRFDAVELLIESGACRQPSTLGIPCFLMHEATQLQFSCDAARMVRLLTQLGVDPNETNEVAQPSEGSTALHKACQRHGRLEVIKALIECGANTGCTSQAQTPAYHAVRLGNHEELALLLSCGADPNNAGTEPLSLLHAAIEPPHHQAVNLLLAHGADPNHGIHRDGTPVFWAVKHGNAQALAWLLEAGADPGDHNGLDLMRLADQCTDPQITQLLQSARQGRALQVETPMATAARLGLRL